MAGPLITAIRTFPGRVQSSTLFRWVFAALAMALVSLSLSVLIDEKRRRYGSHADGLSKTHARIIDRLRHPVGQLALLNPPDVEQSGLRPLMLPFSAIDFSDRGKTLRAIEMSGCGRQYPDGASICAAVGSSPAAGGYLYLVATVSAGRLVPHGTGDLVMSGVHRVRIDLTDGQGAQHWIAPFELAPDGSGRLTGYAGLPPLARGVRPVRDFSGWLWQDWRCNDPQREDADCPRTTFVSLRLPVPTLQEAAMSRRAAWPPADLREMRLRVRLLSPDGASPVFDSDRSGAVAPFSLGLLGSLLAPGERLTIRRIAPAGPERVFVGDQDGGSSRAPWLTALVRLLPVGGPEPRLRWQDTVTTPLGAYEVLLTGDIDSVNRAIARDDAQRAWAVAAMLGALLAAWATVEILVIRRIKLLTQRAAAVSPGMRAGTDPVGFDLSDLGGRDEVGVLAQALKDLLERVDDDLRREQIRIQQERLQWQAIGHEIRSPLQSLSALHSQPGDASAPYVRRMLGAIDILYGQGSVVDGFGSVDPQMTADDLDAFLAEVASNAPLAGVPDVAYARLNQAVMVQFDPDLMSTVLSHLLNNANRHRTPGTLILITLEHGDRYADLRLRNIGPGIPEDRIGAIFAYGVRAHDQEGGTLGQGLFVVSTYVSRMNGHVVARNTDDGVCFSITFPLAVPALPPRDQTAFRNPMPRPHLWRSRASVASRATRSSTLPAGTGLD